MREPDAIENAPGGAHTNCPAVQITHFIVGDRRVMGIAHPDAGSNPSRLNAAGTGDEVVLNQRVLGNGNFAVKILSQLTDANSAGSQIEQHTPGHLVASCQHTPFCALKLHTPSLGVSNGAAIESNVTGSYKAQSRGYIRNSLVIGQSRSRRKPVIMRKRQSLKSDILQSIGDDQL